MICWKCKKKLDDSVAKISFRASCPSCGRDLHACVGCRYYSPGKPNDCLVPGTEFIRDREAANYCEEFKPLTQIEEKGNLKKNFDSLFKEDL